MDASMEPKLVARRLFLGYRGFSGMDSHDTTTLRPVEELLEAYPKRGRGKRPPGNSLQRPRSGGSFHGRARQEEEGQGQVQLIKQGRAFGVGAVLATQNPMDLDYRALSNAGIWMVGRLQTDADRKRVVEAMSNDGNLGDIEPEELSETVKVLSPRWFVMRNVHRSPSLALVKSRTTLSWMRGPMTRRDLRRVVGGSLNGVGLPEGGGRC
jgi:hypothetical protein